MQACKHCAKSKAKQKNIKKVSMGKKASVQGQRLYLDLSKMTVKTSESEHVTINHDNRKVLVCEATGKKWSHFTATKRSIVQHIYKHLNKLKA